jgi:hypothetical protein
MSRRFFLALASLALGLVLPSCESMSAADHAAVAARDARILAEPRGDYFIGRRYFTDKCRYWGYVRRPGQPWDKATLVVMDETAGALTPDRLPETPSGGGAAHGYDHNFEYRITGQLTGRLIYDPNADMELPAFIAQRFELLSEKPGFLFSPSDPYRAQYIPAREAHRQTAGRR